MRLLSVKELNYLLYCTRSTLRRSDSLLTDEDKAYIEEVLVPMLYEDLEYADRVESTEE